MKMNKSDSETVLGLLFFLKLKFSYFFLHIKSIIYHHIIQDQMWKNISITKLFSNLAPSPLTRFPYPFEYTYSNKPFQYQDIRFQQYEILNQLYEKQRNHLRYVLGGFQNLLNKQTLQNNQILDFIHPRLVQKVRNFHDIQNQLNIKSIFKINHDSFTSTNGFLQIDGLKDQYKYIHEYKIVRQHQRLKLSPRAEELKKQEAEKKIDNKGGDKSRSQLQESMKEMVNKNGGMKQKLTQKFSKAMDFSLTKSKITSYHKFDPFILVERIDGSFYHESMVQDQTLGQEVKMVTKWLYNIDKNEPQQIRKSRKRQLFDFQFWNRGSFIPVKQFI